MHPYRPEPQKDPLAEAARLDAELRSVRATRRFLTSACAVFSTTLWLKSGGLRDAGVALWGAAGLVALLCWVQERQVDRLRRRHDRLADHVP